MKTKTTTIFGEAALALEEQIKNGERPDILYYSFEIISSQTNNFAEMTLTYTVEDK